jgi:hypothetical protein
MPDMQVVGRSRFIAGLLPFVAGPVAASGFGDESAAVFFLVIGLLLAIGFTLPFGVAGGMLYGIGLLSWRNALIASSAAMAACIFVLTDISGPDFVPALVGRIVACLVVLVVWHTIACPLALRLLKRWRR